MVRCFIGVFVPNELKNKILAIQNEIKAIGESCKFVESENLHVSLSFLGEVPEEEIKNVSSELDLICRGHKKSEAIISGIKLIPNENYVRVVVIEVENDDLKTLAEEIKERIGGDVKPPHLTLCRVGYLKDKQKFAQAIKMIDGEVGSFTVASVQLIKSDLSRAGPKYTTIHEAKLG